MGYLTAIATIPYCHELLKMLQKQVQKENKDLAELFVPKAAAPARDSSGTSVASTMQIGSEAQQVLSMEKDLFVQATGNSQDRVPALFAFAHNSTHGDESGQEHLDELEQPQAIHEQYANEPTEDQVNKQWEIFKQKHHKRSTSGKLGEVSEDLYCCRVQPFANATPVSEHQIRH